MALVVTEVREPATAWEAKAGVPGSLVALEVTGAAGKTWKAIQEALDVALDESGAGGASLDDWEIDPGTDSFRVEVEYDGADDGRDYPYSYGE